MNAMNVLTVDQSASARREMDADDLADPGRYALSAFLEVRPRLFRIAYRTLGDAGETEDVVQEAWIRWQRADSAAIANPAAYLAVTASRLALNVVTSARATREKPIDPDALEPLPSDEDPQRRSELDQAVERAMALLLATLTRTELTAYLLRTSFDYPYVRIGELLGLRPDNVRQLVSRARRGLGTRSRRPVARDVLRRHVDAFRAAGRAGDLDALERVLCAAEIRA